MAKYEVSVGIQREFQDDEVSQDSEAYHAAQKAGEKNLKVRAPKYTKLKPLTSRDEKLAPAWQRNLQLNVYGMKAVAVLLPFAVMAWSACHIFVIHFYQEVDEEPEHAKGDYGRGYDHAAYEASDELKITSPYVQILSILQIVVFSLILCIFSCGAFILKQQGGELREAMQTQAISSGTDAVEQYLDGGNDELLDQLGALQQQEFSLGPKQVFGKLVSAAAGGVFFYQWLLLLSPPSANGQMVASCWFVANLALSLQNLVKDITECLSAGANGNKIAKGMRILCSLLIIASIVYSLMLMISEEDAYTWLFWVFVVSSYFLALTLSMVDWVGLQDFKKILKASMRVVMNALNEKADEIMRAIHNKEAKTQAETKLKEMRSYGDYEDSRCKSAFDELQQIAKTESKRLVSEVILKVLHFHKQYSWGFNLLSMFETADHEMAQIAPDSDTLKSWGEDKDEIMDKYVTWSITQAESYRAEFESLCKMWAQTFNSAWSSASACKKLGLPSELGGLPLTGSSGRHRLKNGKLVNVGFGPPKDPVRAKEKSSAGWLDGYPEPRARYALTDLLRVTFTVANPYVMGLLAAAMHKSSKITIIRQKNVHIENEAKIRSPPVLQMNGTVNGVIVEIMIMLQDFVDIKHELHLYYELERAPKPASLEKFKFH